MTTNPYFNNWNSTSEQALIEDLIIESIKMYGMNVYYLPKTLEGYDELYGEDAKMSFNQAIPVEMYIKNVDSFGGDGSFLSKFNIEIRDQMTLTVARKRFANAVATAADIPRPNEGDLVYFPLNNKMFRIQYTDEKAIFYQLGGLQTWDLTMEVFEYSNERFNTGIAAIDEIETRYSTSLSSFAILTNDGKILVDQDGYSFVNSSYDEYIEDIDPFADNEEIQDEADEIIDFSEGNPWSETRY